MPELLPFPETSERGPSGRMEAAWDVGIRSASEQYSTIETGDGAQLLIKATPTKVLRIKDSDDGRGAPAYVVHSQTIVVVDQKPVDRQEGG